MGWFYSQPTQAGLLQQLLAPDSTFSRDREVIAHSLVGNELWTVVRLTLKIKGIIKDNAIGDTYTFIQLDLIDQYGGSWGHKPLSEEAGPLYYGCPLSFLEMAPDGVNKDWCNKLREAHQA